MRSKLWIPLAVALCAVPFPSDGARKSNSARADQLAPMARSGVIPAGTCIAQLADGGLMMIGGTGASGALETVQIFGTDGSVSRAASLQSARSRHACVTLDSGRVLVMGGASESGAMNTAEFYDPATNQWQPAGSMADARMGLTATLLADGRVLVAGGGNGAIAFDTLEVYDPAANTFRMLPARLSSPRTEHAAARLSNGTVLLAGGADGSRILDTIEIYDPANELMRQGGVMATPRAGLTATAVSDGTVLLAGGWNGREALDTVEAYDPASGKLAPAGKMAAARRGQLALAMPDSAEVLLVGGDAASSSEVFQAQAGAASTVSGGAKQVEQRAATGAALSVSSTGDVRAAAPVGSATLDQCANGPLAGGVIGLTCEWVNGNLNSSKASYREGDSVAYRLRMSGLPNGSTNSVTIEWDTTQQGKHALDYITTYNQTITGAVPCLNCGTQTTYAIPADPNFALASGHAQIPGVLTIWGGTITGVSAYALSGTYAGNSSTAITITFTASQADPVLAWGGHIATRVDWGAGFSAVALSGSPYHMRLKDLNGSGGNQDRSLSNDAAVFPAHLVIVKDVRDAQGSNMTSDSAFTFTTTGFATVPTFSVKDDGTTGHDTWTSPDILSFNSNGTGTTTYTVTEDDPGSAWLFKTLSCSVVAGAGTAGSYQTTGRKVSFTPNEGDTLTCTYTNWQQVATLTVKKVCSPAGDSGKFNLLIDGKAYGGEILCGGDTGAVTVAIDTAHTVTEQAVSPTDIQDYGSAIVCDGTGNGTITLKAGENKTCTVTNTRLATAIVKKVIVGTATDFVFTGGVAGTISSDGGTIQKIRLEPGTYTSTESAAAGWTLNSITCSDANSTVDTTTRTATFKLEAGETVTCTFTNTQKGTIIVKKVMEGGDRTFTFTGDVAGDISANNGTLTKSDLDPGTYYSTEADYSGAGWKLTSISCTGSDSSGDPASRKATFKLKAGETITCTFTNTKQATLKVMKKMIGGTGTFVFTGDVSGSLSDEVTALSATNVEPGKSYTSTEGDYSSTFWKLTLIECEGGIATGSLSERKVTFNPKAGETITCTFTNTKAATAVVVKKMIGGTDTFSFSGVVNGSISTDDGSLTKDGLDAGTYTATEGTAPTGWKLTSITCDDAAGTGNVSTGTATFNLTAGKKVTCTFTNTKLATAIVKKTMIGGTGSFSFTGTVAGTITTNDGTIKVANLDPGDYTSTESAASGWALTSISCDDGSSGDLNSRTATFKLAAGKTVTCTFTNVLPSISVTKECATTMGSDLNLTVGSSGWVCNQGGVDVQTLSVTDVQVGGTQVSIPVTLGAGSDVLAACPTPGSCSKDNHPSSCRSFTSTYKPVQASGGTTACTLTFSDLAKATVYTVVGNVKVESSKQADCPLCGCVK